MSRKATPSTPTVLRPMVTNLVSLQLEMEPAELGEDDDHVHGPDCGHTH